MSVRGGAHAGLRGVKRRESIVHLLRASVRESRGGEQLARAQNRRRVSPDGWRPKGTRAIWSFRRESTHQRGKVSLIGSQDPPLARLSTGSARLKLISASFFFLGVAARGALQDLYGEIYSRMASPAPGQNLSSVSRLALNNPMVSYLSYVSQSKTRFCLFFDESNNEKSKSYLDTKLF